MRVSNLNGTLTLLEDNVTADTNATVLNSPVTITKATSSSKGKQANIESVRNNKVVVNLDGSYKTYSFEDLSN